MLTLRDLAYLGDGSQLGTGRQVFLYEVYGLPAGQQAWVAHLNERWQVLRSTGGVQDGWSGDFASSEAALLALENGER
jgi:hypothetical protein